MPKLPTRPSAKMNKATKSKAWKNTGSLFAQRGYALNKQWDDQDSYRKKGRDFENDTANSQDWNNYVDKYDMGGMMTGGGDAYGSADGSGYAGDWQQYEDRFQWGLNQEGAPLTPDAARAAEIQNQQGYDQGQQQRDREVSRENSQQNPMSSAKAYGGMVPRYDGGGKERKVTDIVAGVGIPLVALGSAYGMGFRPGVFDLKGPNIKENSFIDKLMQSKNQFPPMPSRERIWEGPDAQSAVEEIGRGYGYEWDQSDPYWQYMKPILPEEYKNYNPERIIQYPSYDREPMLWDAADRSHAQIEPVRENTEASNRVAHNETERATNLYNEYNPVRRAFSHIWRWGPAGRARNSMNAAIEREGQVREAGARSLAEVTNQHRSHMGVIAQSIARNEELLASMARQRRQAETYRNAATTTDVSRELDAPTINRDTPMVSTMLPSANAENPANVSTDTAEQFPITPQLNTQTDRDRLLSQNIDPRFLSQSNLPSNASPEDIRRLVIQNPEAAQNVEQNINHTLFDDTSEIAPGQDQDTYDIPLTTRGRQMQTYYARRPGVVKPNNLVGFHMPASDLPPEYNKGTDMRMPEPGQDPATVPTPVQERMRAFAPPKTDLGFGFIERDEDPLAPPKFSRTHTGAKQRLGQQMAPGFGIFESGMPEMTNESVKGYPGYHQGPFYKGQQSLSQAPKKSMRKILEEVDPSALSDTPGDVQEKIRRKPFNTTVKPHDMPDSAWELARNPEFRITHKIPAPKQGELPRPIYKPGDALFRDKQGNPVHEFEYIPGNPGIDAKIANLEQNHPEVKIVKERKTRAVNKYRVGGGTTVNEPYTIYKFSVDEDISRARHHANHRVYGKADGGFIPRYDNGGVQVPKYDLGVGLGLGALGLSAGMGVYGFGKNMLAEKQALDMQKEVIKQGLLSSQALGHGNDNSKVGTQQEIDYEELIPMSNNVNKGVADPNASPEDISRDIEQSNRNIRISSPIVTYDYLGRPIPGQATNSFQPQKLHSLNSKGSYSPDELNRELFRESGYMGPGRGESSENGYAYGGYVPRYEDGDDGIGLKAGLIGGAALGGIGLLAGGYGGGVRFTTGGTTNINGQNATAGFYLKPKSFFNPEPVQNSISRVAAGQGSAGDLRRTHVASSDFLNRAQRMGNLPYASNFQINPENVPTGGPRTPGADIIFDTIGDQPGSQSSTQGNMSDLLREASLRRAENQNNEPIPQPIQQNVPQQPIPQPIQQNVPQPPDESFRLPQQPIQQPNNDVFSEDDNFLDNGRTAFRVNMLPQHRGLKYNFANTPEGGVVPKSFGFDGHRKYRIKHHEDGGQIQRYDDGGYVDSYAFGGYSKQVNEQMDQARQQQIQQQQMQGQDPNQMQQDPNQMQQQMPQQDPNAGMAGAPPQQMGQQLQQEEQQQPVTLKSGVVDVTGMLAPEAQGQGQPPMGQPQSGDVQAMSNLPYYQNQYAKMAQHAADPKRTLYRANKGTKFQTA